MSRAGCGESHGFRRIRLRAVASLSLGSVAPVAMLNVTRRPPVRAAVASRTRALGAVLRRHWQLAVLVAAAAVLRLAALVAIYPGIWFSDSNGYIQTAATGTLLRLRVSGYSLLVAPFWHAGSAGALIIVQHLIGLVIVVGLYALLVHRDVPRWLALLAVVPAALDAYLIVLEHAIMAETVFHAALFGAIAALLWHDRPGLAAAAGAGLLLGYAGVVRSVAVPFVAVFVCYLLARRVSWRPLVAFGVCWALVMGAYATLFDVQHGKFGFTRAGGAFLYARVAPFADCSRLEGLPVNERLLCPDRRRATTTNGTLWGPDTPLRRLRSGDPRVHDFALRVIRDRPLTYARVVAAGVAHYFEPGHRIGPNDYSDAPWRFPADPRRPARYPGYRGPIRPGRADRQRATYPNQYVSAMVDSPRTHVRLSQALRTYQRYAYTSGQVLALCVLLVLAALATRRGAWRLRLDAALLVAMTLTALFVAMALSVFSYRYGLIAVVFLPAAAGLAGAALLHGRFGGPARAASRGNWHSTSEQELDVAGATTAP